MFRGGSLVVGVKVGVGVGVVRVRVRRRDRVRVRVRVLCNRMHGLHQLGVSAGGYLCVGQARSHTHTSQKCMSGLELWAGGLRIRAHPPSPLLLFEPLLVHPMRSHEGSLRNRCFGFSVPASKVARPDPPAGAQWR